MINGIIDNNDIKAAFNHVDTKGYSGQYDGMTGCFGWYGPDEDTFGVVYATMNAMNESDDKTLNVQVHIQGMSGCDYMESFDIRMDWMAGIDKVEQLAFYHSIVKGYIRMTKAKLASMV